MSNHSNATAADFHATAAARLAGLTTAQVVEQWNLTDALLKSGLDYPDAVLVIQARQWILNDLERRDEDALVTWLESNAENPAPFYGVEA